MLFPIFFLKLRGWGRGSQGGELVGNRTLANEMKVQILDIVTN